MKNIPYGRQSVDQSDIKAVVNVLKSDWLTQGSKVKEFEKALSSYTGAKYAVLVSSGTAALHLACLVVGISKGDEVMTSPVTFVASANCALYCGAKPLFADVDSVTANITPESISQRINSKTKALIPVHFAGFSCDMKAIKNLAIKNKLIVIEDACHALGASYEGLKVGSCKYSDMTVFSFHPVKSITTGEGGAITTNNKKYYEKLIMLRQHGVTKSLTRFINKKLVVNPWHHEMQMLGFNYRITDFQCALGLSQLKKLNKFIQERRRMAGIYNKAFKNNKFFDLPKEVSQVRSSWHLYSIKLKDKYKNKKAKIFASLREHGLGVQVHYIPVYRQPYYQKLGYKKGLCPNGEDFYKREISIPLYPSMCGEDIKYAIDTIFKVFRQVV